jgi:zinc resistance-associated protein
MESSMWKALVVGTTLVTMAGATLANAQQPSQAERPHHARMTADDAAAFTDARIAAFKTALKLTPAQEGNWPAVEQAIRDISKERVARREARRAAGPRADAIERLRDRADALASRAAALKRLADAEQPLYQSLDEAQKRRFDMLVRFAARRHMHADARPSTQADCSVATSPHEPIGARWRGL